eukprot:9940777-Alexandrium_andersonii.AAC.1
MHMPLPELASLRVAVPLQNALADSLRQSLHKASRAKPCVCVCVCARSWRVYQKESWGSLLSAKRSGVEADGGNPVRDDGSLSCLWRDGWSVSTRVS